MVTGLLLAAAVSASDAGVPPPAASDAGTAARPAAPSAVVPTSGGLIPYPLDIRTLKNGLRVVMVPTGPGGLASYDTLVRVGSRNEVEAGRTGFAHFFEHMMFRGTEAYPADKYGQTLQAAGINNNAETDDDFTLFTNYGPSESLPTVIAVEADRFQHLKYSVEGFKTEAKAVLGEYNKDVADPEFELDEQMHKAAFLKSTYRHTTMGFAKDIRRMPEEYDYSLQFLKRWYVPGNATIFVVGDFRPAEVYAQIAKAYGGWSGKVSSVRIPKEGEQRKKNNIDVRWTTQTLPRVALGFHAPSLGSDLKASAIQNLLGPYLLGPASALYRNLVLDQHLAVNLSSWYGDHREPYLFYLVATAKDEKALQPIEDAINQAIASLQKDGPDAKLLADVKSNQHYSLLMSFETPAALAGALAMSSSSTGDRTRSTSWPRRWRRSPPTTCDPLPASTWCPRTRRWWWCGRRPRWPRPKAPRRQGASDEALTRHVASSSPARRLPACAAAHAQDGLQGASRSVDPPEREAAGLVPALLSGGLDERPGGQGGLDRAHRPAHGPGRNLEPDRCRVPVSPLSPCRRALS